MKEYIAGSRYIFVAMLLYCLDVTNLLSVVTGQVGRGDGVARLLRQVFLIEKNGFDSVIFVINITCISFWPNKC